MFLAGFVTLPFPPYLKVRPFSPYRYEIRVHVLETGTRIGASWMAVTRLVNSDRQPRSPPSNHKVTQKRLEVYPVCAYGRMAELGCHFSRVIYSDSQGKAPSEFLLRDVLPLRVGNNCSPIDREATKYISIGRDRGL